MNLHLRIPPLAVTVLAGLAGWVLASALPHLHFTMPARTWLVVAFALAGAGFSALGVLAFRRARTTVNPLTPAAAATLVAFGIYRVTRNPMYVGFLCFLLAELTWLAHPVAWLAAPAFVAYLNRFQIVPEETALGARFGREYALYSACVPRWL